jgi:hypothetical protein
MPTDLTTDADIFYGSGGDGYTFSVHAKTVGVNVKPVWDAAKRTIVMNVYTFTIKDYVFDATSTSADIEQVRTQLTKPAGTFTYQNTGFGGTFTFNTAKKDLAWGPKPSFINFTYHGNERAWEFTWQVEVATMDCADALADGILEFNYKVAFDVDQSGYTKRTYTGHLIIPQTRASQNDRALKDTADDDVAKVIPALVHCFRRTTKNRVLSEDKCRVDFTIVDEEMPCNIPPPLCVTAQASHETSTNQPGLQKWTGTINGTYEMKKGVSPRLAIGYFSRLVEDRMTDIRKAGIVIPMGFAAREPEIYGKSIAGFSFTYSIATNLANILALGGMWRPAPDSNWAKWSASMGGVLHYRGLADLRLRAGEDAIVDLCGAQGIRVPGGGTECSCEDKQAAAAVVRLLKIPFVGPQLTPKNSWVDYKLLLKIEKRDEIVVLKKLPARKPPPKNEAAPSPNQPAFILQHPDGPNMSGEAAPGNVIIQERVEPTFYATLIGCATRAGYSIAEPVLRSIGGALATRVSSPGNGWWTGIVGGIGIPLVGAFWQQMYVLKGAPSGPIKEFPDPLAK